MNNKQEDRLLHGGDYNPEQWLDYPEILQKDLELMRQSRVNTVSVGIFAWSTLEPEEGRFEFDWLDKIFDDIHQLGGNVILATPSGARPAWMSESYPEVLRTNSQRQKMLHGGRHNHCFSSPIYREKVAIINKKLAERYGQHPALYMWHISNEYGGDCHCEYCQENFRHWLKRKYGTLDTLNHAWWGPFWSHSFSNWHQVESPSPIGEEAVHGQNLDWKQFVTDQTIDFYRHEIKEIRRICPQVPVTTNFMADTADLIPFQSLDYSKFAKEVDILSWDCYPAWHNDWETTAELASKVGFIDDLYRSLKQRSFLLMESTPSAVNWHPVNKAKRPGMHLLSAMQHIAHGSDSSLYFQWRKSRGSSEKFHGAVVDHDNDSNNRVFQDVAEVGRALEKLQSVRGDYKDARVAILYDWNNDWALNDCQGYAQKTKRYPQTLQEHYRFFWEQDIPVEVITPEMSFDKYDLVIAPMLYLVSEATMEKMATFVTQGGTLVSTYLSGVVNENDLTYLGGWPAAFQQLFGLCVKETDTFYPKDSNWISAYGNNYRVKDYASLFDVRTAKIVGNYETDFYAGQPAITVNHYGEGKAWYLGARTDQELLDDFYSQIVTDLNLRNQLVNVGDPEVSIQSRDSVKESHHFIMNFSEQPKKIILACEAGKDLLSGKLHDNVLLLKPYEVLAFKMNKFS
jgi:beta-galactosidase